MWRFSDDRVESMTTERCRAKTWTDPWHPGRCPNKVKYGEYSGVHAPEKRAERRKARGPSQLDQELAVLAKRKKHLTELEKEVDTYRRHALDLAVNREALDKKAARAALEGAVTEARRAELNWRERMKTKQADYWASVADWLRERAKEYE